MSVEIPSGTFLTPDTVHLDFQIEGIASSTGFGADSILVDAISATTGPALSDEANYTVVETGIGVDGNRDTKVDFANSHDRQLLFWINNDQEGVHPRDTVAEFEETNITAPDNADNVIGQQRDLEDFSHLRVQVDELLANNTFDVGKGGTQQPGELAVTHRLVLKDNGGSSLRLFESNAGPTGTTTSHIFSDVTAQNQVVSFGGSLGDAFGQSFTLETTDGGIDSYLFEAIGGVYGVPFTAAPTLFLETEVQYGNGTTSTKRHAVDLELRDIKQFYTRWDIDFVDGTFDTRIDPSFQHFDTPQVETHASQVTDKPFWSGDDTIVYVHGWNNSAQPNMDDKAAGSETMLKRLYWQGYTGEFVAFNWPTYVDREVDLNYSFDLVETPDALALSYNPSEFQAFRSAKALKEILADYRGTAPNLQPVHLLAHSMGNVVAGEAMRQWAFDMPFNDDPLMTTYVAMEGAISAGAWGDNSQDSIFPRTNTGLWRFFQHGRDGLNDPSLGTLSYLSGANFSAEKMVNMYNEEDNALGWWDFNNAQKRAATTPRSPIWQRYLYQYEIGAGGNTNTDTFRRIDEVQIPDEVTILDLALPNGRPGPNAYEIIAFYAQAASLAIGTKPVARFDVNIDINT